jgi:apolipoprotein N-acyltransferase
MKKIFLFLSSLWAACPYTLLGKRTLRPIRVDATPVTSISHREHHLESRVKIGWAILLVGFFCPFFWIALFSGARGQMLYFNAIHSCLVMLFGFGYLLRSRFELTKEKRKRNVTMDESRR